MNHCIFFETKYCKYSSHYHSCLRNVYMYTYYLNRFTYVLPNVLEQRIRPPQELVYRSHPHGFQSSNENSPQSQTRKGMIFFIESTHTLLCMYDSFGFYFTFLSHSYLLCIYITYIHTYIVHIIVINELYIAWKYPRTK